MNYYAVSDVHGFYDQLISALTEAGWFADKEPKKLILCGDALDRGSQANELTNFLLELRERNELVFVRGNHEDLLVRFKKDFLRDPSSIAFTHHARNGTLNTAVQLAGFAPQQIITEDTLESFVKAIDNHPFCSVLMQETVDYFETANYIFVHGWIPTKSTQIQSMPFSVEPLENFRVANKKQWETARWYNGMWMASLQTPVLADKTIVCGHWHSSWGHYHLGDAEEEFGAKANYLPFAANGIIAIDACTAHTHKVNCLKIVDEELTAGN